MPEDKRRFPCPTCGETVLQIGRQCGFCGKFCTEERVRKAETTRKKALLVVCQQPALEEFL